MSKKQAQPAWHQMVQQREKRWGEGSQEPPKMPPLPALPNTKLVPERENKGTLYLREGALDMPTVCPKSMTWLLYFTVMKNSFPNFGITIVHTNEGDNVPRFETTQGEHYIDLEDFCARNVSLEPKRTHEQKPSKIRDEQEVLAKIEERKENMRHHLTNLENAYIYGYSLLNNPNAQWISNIVNDIKLRVGINDDEQLQHQLMEKSENAFQSLSVMLKDKTYFMDDLRKEFDKKNVKDMEMKSDLFGHREGVGSLTISDAKMAAICMLIAICFDHEFQLVNYNSRLKITLFRHLSLWSQASRLFQYYIKDRQQTVRSQRSILVDTIQATHVAGLKEHILTNEVLCYHSIYSN